MSGRRAGSIVDEVEPAIRELLQAFPTMPATVIAERIGWTRGITVFKDRVALLRPVYLPPDPASRTAYAAGGADPERLLVSGCDDSGRVRSDPDGEGVAGADDGLRLFTVAVGAAHSVAGPRRTCLPAGGSCCKDWVGCRGCWSGTVKVLSVGTGAVTAELTGECQAFRGTLAAKVYVCKPADPEAKGLVERANGYLETSFLPGRTFNSPADFNFQLQGWLAQANTRNRRALGCAPCDRIAADRAGMLDVAAGRSRDWMAVMAAAAA